MSKQNFFLIARERKEGKDSETLNMTKGRVPEMMGRMAPRDNYNGHGNADATPLTEFPLPYQKSPQFHNQINNKRPPPRQNLGVSDSRNVTKDHAQKIGTETFARQQSQQRAAPQLNNDSIMAAMFFEDARKTIQKSVRTDMNDKKAAKATKKNVG